MISSMLRRQALVVPVLALALPLLALAASTAALADPPAWRVEAESGSELWLLGSVHLLREQDYPLPDVVDTLYSNAHTVVMELDLDDLDPAEAQTAFLGAALLPNGETLSDRLEPDVYQLAEERARAFGLDLRALERFEPWLVAVTMLELGMAQNGFAANLGIEQYLLAKAAQDGKEVLGLESMATQVAVFDRLSPDEQEALLAQTLEEIETAGALVDEMIAAWRNGELETLADQLSSEYEAFPELYDALVVERNDAWIDALATYLESPDRHLVVVGALHLVGEHNVVDLLRDRGYTVEPLR